MSELIGARVELTGPDGMVYRFRYGATIPYAGENYAVLLSEEAGEDEILITRMEEQDGTVAFIAAEEDDVVEPVWSKYCDLQILAAVQDLPEAGEP